IADLAPQQLNRSVTDNLVGIHVCRGTGSSLKNIEHEVLVQLTRDYLVGSFADCVRLLIRQKAERTISICSGPLNHAKGANIFALESKSAYRKIQNSTLGSGAI